MAADGHFGWTKITFDHFFEKISQNGCRSIKSGCILDDRKSLSIAFLDISDQYANFFFSQNGNMQKKIIFIKWPPTDILEVRFVPFWMTENHFRSFQINTQLLFSQNGNKQLLLLLFFYNMVVGGHFGWPKITFNRISRHFRSIRKLIFFTKWQYATILKFFKSDFGNPIWAILDDRKSLSIISDQYATLFSQNGKKQLLLYFFYNMVVGGHFGWPKITFNRISRNFRSIRFFSPNGAGGHFGWPKITFDGISRHFRSIRNFDFFFSPNGCWRPLWMTENHFRSHFSAFQIIMQLLFFWIFFTKWLPAAILDDRKSLSMAFLAISDQCTTFYFFHKMAACGHFGWPKITFDRISRYFRSIRNFYFFGFFFHKMAAGDHFGWPKITFNRITRHFRSIRNFHFGLPKITFNRITCHFRPTRNFSFFWFFFQNGRRRPFWTTENHFWSHYSPFQINTPLFFFLIFLQNGGRRPFWKSDLGHFEWSKITFDRISCHFRSILNFFVFQNVRFAPKTIGFFHYVLSMAMPNMKLIDEWHS